MAVAAVRARGPRFARAALARTHELVNCSAHCSSRFGAGAVNIGPPALTPRARGPSSELLQAPGSFPGPRNCPLPPRAPPARCQPRCFGCLPVGGARASTSLLLLATGFCSTPAPRRSHFLHSRPPATEPNACAIAEVLLIAGKCPSGELSPCGLQGC